MVVCTQSLPSFPKQLQLFCNPHHPGERENFVNGNVVIMLILPTYAISWKFSSASLIGMAEFKLSFCWKYELIVLFRPSITFPSLPQLQNVNNFLRFHIGSWWCADRLHIKILQVFHPHIGEQHFSSRAGNEFHI